MGNAGSSLIGKEALIHKSLIGLNLNQLRLYHSTLQNILKSLSITSEEFEEIFKCRSFSIWDTDANGLISPLEVISGLTMLSNTSPKDKFQCDNYLVLFGLFDFNGEGEITICDLKLIIHLSLLSVCKIFGHSNDMGMNEENEITANRELNSKINLNDMMTICSQHPHVTYFMNICEILKTSSSDLISNSSLHHQYYD